MNLLTTFGTLIPIWAIIYAIYCRSCDLIDKYPKSTHECKDTDIYDRWDYFSF